MLRASLTQTTGPVLPRKSSSNIVFNFAVHKCLWWIDTIIFPISCVSYILHAVYTCYITIAYIWFSYDHFMKDEYQNCQDNSNDILIQNFCWIFLTYFQLWVLCALKSKDREKSLDCSSKWNICKYLHSWANICICVQEVAFCAISCTEGTKTVPK